MSTKRVYRRCISTSPVSPAVRISDAVMLSLNHSVKKTQKRTTHKDVVRASAMSPSLLRCSLKMRKHVGILTELRDLCLDELDDASKEQVSADLMQFSVLICSLETARDRLINRLVKQSRASMSTDEIIK